MSTSPDFITYLTDQLRGSGMGANARGTGANARGTGANARGTGAVRSKKMFGEYMIYVDEKPLFLICDDTVYIKILPETTALLESLDFAASVGVPYGGAKEHYILDPDNAALLREASRVLLPITSLPKSKKRKLL